MFGAFKFYIFVFQTQYTSLRPLAGTKKVEIKSSVGYLIHFHCFAGSILKIDFIISNISSIFFKTTPPAVAAKAGPE